MTNRNGAKWIRRDKRLAIYLRDGMACAYCGSVIEDGVTLGLDHLVPRSAGGGNEAANLITCCNKCNSSRGDRGVTEFVEAVAVYLNHGIQASEILDHIRTRTVQKLKPFRDEAKVIIGRRSTFSKAVREAARSE